MIRATDTTDEQTAWAPPGRLPPYAFVRYWKDFITLVLLVLALPWLMRRPARIAGAS